MRYGAIGTLVVQYFVFYARIFSFNSHYWINKETAVYFLNIKSNRNQMLSLSWVNKYWGEGGN